MQDPAFARRSTLVFSGLALSIALGLILQSYLASTVGTSRVGDIFYLGTTLPTLIATATLGSSSSALIRYATEEPHVLNPLVPASAGRKLVLLSFIPCILLVVIGVCLSAGFVTPVNSGTATGLGTFLLVTSPVPIMITVAAVGAVLALGRERFIRATWGPAVNGAGLLLVAVALGINGLTVVDLALAVNVGYLAQLCFVATGIPSTSHTFRRGDARAARAATVSVLLLFGASVVYKSQPLIERSVGATLGAGVPAALGYADKITMGLTQLAVFGFALVSLPALSRDLAENDANRASVRLAATLFATATSTVIVVAFGLSSAGDIVRVLYERGEFSQDAANLTTSLVLCALPSVVFGALAGPLVAVAYAQKRVRQVVKVGLLGFAVGTSMTIILASTIGARGVVLGTACGFAFTFSVFAHLTRSFLPMWSWREFFRLYAPRLLVIALVAGTVAVAARLLLTATSASSLLAVVALGGRLVLVAGASFGVSRLMRPSARSILVS